MALSHKNKNEVTIIERLEHNNIIRVPTIDDLSDVYLHRIEAARDEDNLRATLQHDFEILIHNPSAGRTVADFCDQTISIFLADPTM